LVTHSRVIRRPAPDARRASLANTSRARADELGRRLGGAFARARCVSDVEARDEGAREWVVTLAIRARTRAVVSSREA